MREWTSLCGPGASNNVHSKCGTVLSRCMADGCLLLNLISASSHLFCCLGGARGRQGVVACQAWWQGWRVCEAAILPAGPAEAPHEAAARAACGLNGCPAVVVWLPAVLRVRRFSGDFAAERAVVVTACVLQTGRGLSPRPQICNQGRGLQGCRAWMHLWALAFSV